eukprot:3940707-Rhodomonas_salina.1
MRKKIVFWGGGVKDCSSSTNIRERMRRIGADLKQRAGAQDLGGDAKHLGGSTDIWGLIWEAVPIFGG